MGKLKAEIQNAREREMISTFSFSSLMRASASP
jgi:hypothetical protein